MPLSCPDLMESSIFSKRKKQKVSLSSSSDVGMWETVVSFSTFQHLFVPQVVSPLFLNSCSPEKDSPTGPGKGGGEHGKRFLRTIHMPFL